MKTGKCPICDKPARIVSRPDSRGGVVVCRNDDYVHVVKNGVDMVAHTEKNVCEEIESLALLIPC